MTYFPLFGVLKPIFIYICIRQVTFRVLRLEDYKKTRGTYKNTVTVIVDVDPPCYHFRVVARIFGLGRLISAEFEPNVFQAKQNIRLQRAL